MGAVPGLRSGLNVDNGATGKQFQSALKLKSLASRLVCGLEPKHFLARMIYFQGFGRREALMHPLLTSDVLLTVAIMSVTFLTEVGFFILIGMF